MVVHKIILTLTIIMQSLLTVRGDLSENFKLREELILQVFRDNRFEYSFLLGKEQFSAELICLGDQLGKILNCIKYELRNHCWFVFDVFGSSHTLMSCLFPQDQAGICLINTTEELIEKVKKVIQFERGVFIAFPINKEVLWKKNLLPQTEALEGLHHPESEIEIRAFDYSYFEVYTLRDTLSKVFRSCFKFPV
ncbi:hypothetical protein DesyoDRAFT_3080 [Desulfosporosinus youngiae DSM 17734]|uniref:Uncharacterized protein n=1 Tax=Desulfosporosinus youngiae DSM 17734 TaxID=768710 RepID=H5XVN5_9FIRM|nr:hypothetical protein DesyoDRAFT_3080 [Desulfosporosinus youngiae DSM 17734]